jgi:adenosylhomocysteine nucleosidase
MQFYDGKMSGHEIVVVKSGIGKVNAAVCTQIMIDLFQVNSVINTGIAGSLRDEINIGDIVISTDTVQHDVDARELGCLLGQIPGMNSVCFQADKATADLAYQLCRKVNPDVSVYLGRIVSGDQFVSEPLTKKRIRDNFEGLCTEMEGAAIAQTAHLNGIPFLVIRAISDKADNSAYTDFSVFIKQAAIRSLRLTEILIENM